MAGKLLKKTSRARTIHVCPTHLVPPTLVGKATFTWQMSKAFNKCVFVSAIFCIGNINLPRE